MHPVTPTAAQILEHLSRKGLRPPKTLTFSLTGACNLRCRHCWVDAGVAHSASSVPPSMVHRVLEDLASLGGTGVRFTGGEPLCHPRWEEFLRFARGLGLEQVALQTNAMMLDHRGVEFLKGFDFPGLSLQVSLDGATAASHDLARGEGSFRSTVAALRRLAHAGLAPRVSLFLTEMRHNLEELPALLELARELGVKSVSSGALVGCGRAAGDPLLSPPEPEQYLQLLRRYQRDARFRELYALLGSTAAVEWLTPTPHSDCCTFAETPYLTATGRLYPCVLCHADPFSVTGLRHKGLLQAFAEAIPLWSRLLEMGRRRPQEIALCRECPELPFCGGGCLGRAWASYGGVFFPDDRCEVRRAVGKAFSRKATDA